MKACIKCKEVKGLSEFSKHKVTKDGLRNSCRACDAIQIKGINRTKVGKLKRIYDHQVKKSKERNHEPPTYNQKEFVDKFINCPVYLDHHYSWKVSGYEKMYAPSFDRKDDYKGYSFDNIQIMTWKENKEKHHLDRKEGRNNKVSKAVAGTNIKTGDTIEFHSAREAGRHGFDRGGIRSCCLGKQECHKGYTWKHKN